MLDGRRLAVDGPRCLAAWVPALIVVIVLLASADALACTVCFDSKEERRLAFLLTTILLTLAPLALVAGTIFWLRKIASGTDGDARDG